MGGSAHVKSMLLLTSITYFARLSLPPSSPLAPRSLLFASLFPFELLFPRLPETFFNARVTAHLIRFYIRYTVTSLLFSSDFDFNCEGVFYLLCRAGLLSFNCCLTVYHNAALFHLIRLTLNEQRT